MTIFDSKFNDVSGGAYFAARREEQIKSTHYFCRVRNQDYNFSNNSTFVTTSNNLRHAEMIVQQLGLEEAKPLTNPSADEPKREDDEVELNAEYTTQYKSIVARANYLSADRPDIQYAVKKLATNMSKPTNANWNELKRQG